MSTVLLSKHLSKLFLSVYSSISFINGYSPSNFKSSALFQNANNSYNNVAIGENALWENKEGERNTSCGVQSIMNNITGNNNTELGYAADGNSGDLTNATAIGYNAKVNSSNSIELGNTGVTMINTSAGITANSFIKTAGTNIQYLMADGSTKFYRD